MKIPALLTVSAGLLLLAGCATPSAPDDAAATPTPSASSPRPTPSRTPTPAPVESAALVLPDCAGLFTPAEVLALMGDHMEFQPDAHHAGTAIPALQDLLATIDFVGCTWIIPASERGVIISIAPADAAVLAAVSAELPPSGFEPSSGGPFQFYNEVGTEELTYNESQALGPDIWVSVFDGPAGDSRAIVQAVLDKIAALNPGRY